MTARTKGISILPVFSLLRASLRRAGERSGRGEAQRRKRAPLIRERA